MRLGIDFGSRWIVAAVADRGNYPVISFEGEQAGSRQYFPPLVAVQGTRRIYGWDAWGTQSDLVQACLDRREQFYRSATLARHLQVFPNWICSPK